MSEEESTRLEPDSQEAWNYLLEVVRDYERYLADIGKLGLAAPNLLYYRSEVQDMLDDFRFDKRVDYGSVWVRVRALDEVLRTRQQEVVDEIGHANFQQYQIVNDPPRAHWWWWLNRVTKGPPPPPNWWQFWKKTEEPPAPAGDGPSEGPDPEEPAAS